MLEDDETLDEDDEAPDSDPSTDVTVALSAASINFDTQLRALFPDEKDYRILRTIGAFIMRGLSLSEACVLSRISYEKFESLMLQHDPIAEFITFKQTAYKASLLNTLAADATDGKKTRVAGYLLENQYREDFGKKSKEDRTRPPDALDRALEAVRESGDSEPLVRRELPAPAP
jgi:hypothetical protein